MLFTIRLDADGSAAKFLAVIRQSFPTSSAARWSSARMTAVVGRPERRVSLSSVWPPSDPAVRESQRQHSTFINSIGTVYCLTAFECLLLTSSLPQEIQYPLLNRHVTIPPHFDDHLRVCEKTFLGAAGARGTFKINKEKIPSFDCNWCVRSVWKFCGQPSHARMCVHFCILSTVHNLKAYSFSNQLLQVQHRSNKTIRI
jgi:hypothetical protein